MPMSEIDSRKKIWQKSMKVKGEISSPKPVISGIPQGSALEGD